MSLYGRELERKMKGLESAGPDSAGSDMDRKFWVALALFAALAALAWFTLGEGRVLVMGRPVELRLLPLIIIGGLALRTVLARQAERIRRGGDGGGGSTP